MSHPSDIDTHEEQAIWAVLDCRHDPTRSPLPASNASASSHDLDADLLREYSETLAHLPLLLDLPSPRPELRHRVLQLVDACDAPSFEGHTSAESHTSVERHTAVERQHTPKQILTAFSTPAPQATPAAAHRLRWPLALAAVLALAVLGLGLFSLQLHERLTTQDLTIAQLHDDLEQQQRQAQAQVHQAQIQKFVMTQTATRLFQLQPAAAAAEAAEGAGAHGTLYICGQTQKWYVGLTGLQPTPTDSHYTIWFVTDRGEVPSRTFTVVETGFIEVNGDGLPDGVELPEVRGVLVTFGPGSSSEIATAEQAVLRTQRSVEL